ncbi:MAG TPA: hypothetical protein VGJ95_20750 [Pseudonocardiaceae bacterium]
MNLLDAFARPVAGGSTTRGVVSASCVRGQRLPPAPAPTGAYLAVAGTALATGYLAAEFAVGDVAHPGWRARAVGVYRLWRDAAFAAGALLAGLSADLLGLRGAVWIVAVLTAASGSLVAARMYETHPASP